MLLAGHVLHVPGTACRQMSVLRHGRALMHAPAGQPVRYEG
jgi:hypothetical protein